MVKIKRLTSNASKPIFSLTHFRDKLIPAVLILFSVSSHADDAKSLFESHQESIYQIRVIELASGNKSTIGSGFLISDKGDIATNYHVISLFVGKPERYRLEYVAHDGTTGKLDVIDIDVIHDLAITRADLDGQHYFALDETPLSKGTRIYSMGNPHDLGMSIIEGTYNGLLEKTLYDKIFFSGSLNPGMSGGPAINDKGDVIGINVSTAGNQLSFLVPATYLIRLNREAGLRPTPLTSFDQRIEGQLSKHQEAYLQNILDTEWPGTPFGNATLPGKIADIFKCWGDSDDNEEALMEHSFSTCTSEDRLFLASRYTTGGISYSYHLYTAKDISSLHFYNIYNTRFGRTLRVSSARKEDVTNYQCNTDFVGIAGQDWKMALCARNHVKYQSIYDFTLSLAMVSEYRQGLVIQLAVSGATESMAMKFARRFMEEIQWQN